MKTCTQCKRNLPRTSFYKHPQGDGFGAHCKECHKIYSHNGYLKKRKEIGDEKWREKGREVMMRWRKNNPQKALEKSRFYREKYREKYRENRRKKLLDLTKSVYKKYGGKCTCCNESNWRFLSLDHVKNDGFLHRKTTTVRHLSEWAYKNNYPDTLQLLCFNCNLGRAMRGGKDKICPHKLLSN